MNSIHQRLYKRFCIAMNARSGPNSLSINYPFLCVSRILIGISIVGLAFLTGVGSVHADASDNVVVKEITFDRLKVQLIQQRQFEWQSCPDGYYDDIVLRGEIGPESSYAIEKLLSQVRRCTFVKNGRTLTNRTLVFLESNGGLLSDGFRMGRMFRRHGVVVSVKSGRTCASSCAVAFLGANERHLSGTATLLFHAPYYARGLAIQCATKAGAEDMRRYFIEMLDKPVGQRLFDLAMMYCGSNEAWEMNSVKGFEYGILNQHDK